MKTYVLSYIAAAFVFLGLDGIWLSTTTSRLYKPLLGDLLAERVHFGAAAVFYILYIGGIVVFAISPAFGSGRWATAAGHGALLGLVGYATYDLSNQATLQNWPIAITLVDIAWGTFVTAVAATLGYLAARSFVTVD